VGAGGLFSRSSSSATHICWPSIASPTWMDGAAGRGGVETESKQRIRSVPKLQGMGISRSVGITDGSPLSGIHSRPSFSRMLKMERAKTMADVVTSKLQMPNRVYVRPHDAPKTDYPHCGVKDRETTAKLGSQ
jgi:hypothetical protein